MSQDSHHESHHGSHHESKPYANPLGILAGLLILWVASAGLVWLAFKLFSVGGEATG